MIMQKTQLEKGLKRFTQKFRVEHQAARKAILTFKARKEEERPKKNIRHQRGNGLLIVRTLKILSLENVVFFLVEREQPHRM
jgi:hypothetical protein